MRGPSHPDTAPSLWNLGRLLDAQGDPAGAVALLARALAIEEAAGHPHAARHAADLAARRQPPAVAPPAWVATPTHGRAAAISGGLVGDREGLRCTSC